MYLYFLCCVVLFLLRTNCVQIIGNPDSADIHHELVQPVLHYARTKRQLASTKNTESLHHPEVTMMVDIDGQQHVLDLRLNTALVGGDHVISYQKDGKSVLHKPTPEELDICQYSGKVRGKESSWVALSTCHGVRGVIHDGERMRYIEPAEANNVNSKHFIYHYSDLSDTYGTYGLHGDINTNQDLNLTKKYKEVEIRENNFIRHKRDSNIEKVLNGPFDANQDSRYLELVLVADNSVYNSLGKNMSTVHRYLQETANIINSLFAQLNIFIALVGVVVWNERDEIRLADKIDKTLDHFLKYRKKELLPSIPHDNAQLITRFEFQNAMMGHGLLRSICSQNYSGGVNRDIKGVRELGPTIAHTIGHNFGLSHDRSNCLCDGKTCIMGAFVTSTPPTHWSYCSFVDLAKAFSLGVDYCLRNKPKSVYNSSCGNGFVELGEQCDCGVDLWPSSCVKCCDPSTCQFLPNATCSVGDCCDTLTCQPKHIGALCREARKECDLPEYCNGLSEHCPQDVYKMDTTPCSNEAYCVNGECGSRTSQCQVIWGSTSKMANTLCYSTFNNFSNTEGYCGYEQASVDRQKDTRCSEEDALCGLLHCQFAVDTGVFEYKEKYAVEVQENTAYNKDTRFPCISTTRFNYGLSEVPLGLVPDGAKCGEEKMCLNQKCVSITTVAENIKKLETSVCPSNCSGHGVCNSKGHCHCDLGFGPPYCEHIVSGGSIDSGPVFISEYREHYVQTLGLIGKNDGDKIMRELKKNKSECGRNTSVLTIMLIVIYYLIF